MLFISRNKIALKLGMVIGLLFTCQSLTFGQASDSLAECKTELERVKELKDLTIFFMDIDDVRAYKFAREALSLSEKENHTELLLETGRLTTNLMRRLGKLDSAIQLCDDLLIIAIKDSSFLSIASKILNTKAIALLDKGDYVNSLETHYRALDVRRSLRDSVGTAVTLMNIGVVHQRLGNFDRAIELYQESLKLKRLINYNVDVDRTLINISLCFFNKHHLEFSHRYVNDALNVCNSGCTDAILKEANLTLGIIALERKNFIGAEEFLKKGYELAVRTQSIRFQLDILYHLSQLYLKTNRPQEAIEVLTLAATISAANSQFPVENLRIYSALSAIYLTEGNFKEAAVLQGEYIKVSSTLFSEGFTGSLMKTEANYVERNFQSRVEAQREILMLTEQAMHRNTIVNIVISILAFMLLGVALLLFKVNRKRKLLNNLLRDKVQERTAELGINRQEVLQLKLEQSVMVRKLVGDLTTDVVSLKSLCQAAVIDLKDEDTKLYLKKVESTVKTLYENVTIFKRYTGGD